MSILQAIKRELRNARRVISNPDKFSQNTIETSWAVIRSASKRGIFVHPLPYERTCRAYEPDEPVTPLHKIES